MIVRTALGAWLALTLAGSAFAQTLTNARPVRSTALDFVPTYFFKPTPSGSYAGVTSFSMSRPLSNQNHNNYLVDTITGQTHEAPGMYDPVFMQNERLLVTFQTGGLAFYRVSDILSAGRNAKPILIDAIGNGAYQSVGVLQENATETRYRVLWASGTNRFRDYVEVRRGDQTISLEPIGDTVEICPQYGALFKLPMISKDGTEVAGLVNEHMRIFTINRRGACSEVYRLDRNTGKVAFSYDGKLIAYHSFSSFSTSNHVEIPSTDWVSNVFVYNRITGRTAQITRNTADNSMYPEFLRTGELVFLNHPHGRSRKVELVRVAFDSL